MSLEFGAIVWLGIIGSIVSIISFIANIFQGVINRDLKRLFLATICSDEATFDQINAEANQALSFHAVNQEGYLRSIKASAGRSAESLSQLRKRKFQEQHIQSISMDSIVKIEDN